MICIHFFHAEFCKRRETNARKRKQDSILTDCIQRKSIYIQRKPAAKHFARRFLHGWCARKQKKKAVNERQSFFFPSFSQMLPPARIRHILLTGKVLFA